LKCNVTVVGERYGRTVKVALAALSLIVLTACGADATAATPRSGTVTGRVTAGPTCPVERAGHPCPPRAVSADVQAQTRAGAVIASTHTASNGHFTLRLRAGTYALVAVTHKTFPRCARRHVTVKANTVTTAPISCDTGIR